MTSRMRILTSFFTAAFLASCENQPEEVVIDNAVSTETAVEVIEETPALAPALYRAEIRDERAIWFYQSGGEARSLDPADYRLSGVDGREIEITTILPSTATEMMIIPAENLDVMRMYHIEVEGVSQRVRARFDGWFRHVYSDKQLGANIAEDGSQTDIRIFAPRADQVRLYLYDNAEDSPQQARQSLWMERDEDGVFEASFEGDLHGTYYDFTVHGPTEPGSHYYETHPVHISDPYARVNVDAFGKSRIWRPTIPATPLANGRPAMEDVVSYELHLQDFTDLLPVSDELGSTFPAMATSGLTNARGEPIGFDHLIDLGVNVVHFLPVQEFVHYPTEEWRALRGDHPTLQALGIADEDYQWGYRTSHAFAIETRYRQQGSDYGAQRDQFRDLVQAFHDVGIAVIIDLVPNHTGEHMEGRDTPINFEALGRQYYYRTDDEGQHIGMYGNEVKSEDRPMVQRWLFDQTSQLIEEFGIDGFRIDLAGQIDEQTMIALREHLGEDVIIYGEAWIDTNDVYVRNNPDWDWYKEDAPITFFQDTARDALVGSPFILENPETDLGYSGGNETLRPDVMAAIANNFDDESISPTQGINYMDIHDNWTLADRFALNDWDGRNGVNEAGYRVAAGMLLTSLGPVVLHGGSEFMRSKGAAPLHEQYLETDAGILHIKGREDTFNVRTPNQFVWDNIGGTPEDGSVSDFAAMQAWWSGLIHFRLSEAGQPFRTSETVTEEYIQWLTPENQNLLGYIVDEAVMVLVNVGDEDDRFERITLPEGNWRQIADGQVIDHINGVEGPDASLIGGRHTLTTPATSLQIWIRE